MRASLRFAPALALLVFAVAACGDDTGDGSGSSGSGGDASTSGSGTGTPTGSGTGTPTGSGTDASTGTDATTGTDTTSSSSSGSGGNAECGFPDDVETDPDFRDFDVVQATVSTVDGDPVVGDFVVVCGINLCTAGDLTNGSGQVSIAPLSEPFDTPVLKVGDGLLHAKIGYPIPASGGAIEVEALTLPLADSGTTLAPGAEADADGIVLTIAEDGQVELNLLDFSDPGEDTFRAALVPDDALDAIAPGEDFAAIVGIGPHETLFCPPAGLAIPNDAGLEPGTAVEFVQQSLEVGQYFGLYGRWERVAEGHVSEDGATIATDEGQGIPIISTVGVRPM